MGGGSAGDFLKLSRRPKVNWTGELPRGTDRARPSAGGTNSGPLAPVPRLPPSIDLYLRENCGASCMSEEWEEKEVSEFTSEHKAFIVWCSTLMRLQALCVISGNSEQLTSSSSPSVFFFIIIFLLPVKLLRGYPVLGLNFSHIWFVIARQHGLRGLFYAQPYSLQLCRADLPPENKTYYSVFIDCLKTWTDLSF